MKKCTPPEFGTAAALPGYVSLVMLVLWRNYRGADRLRVLMSYVYAPGLGVPAVDLIFMFPVDMLL